MSTYRAQTWQADAWETLAAHAWRVHLAAATQAPLTSFIIVMEMVDGHALVLSLMACAMIARTISKVISAPLYSVLAQQQLVNASPAALPLSPAAVQH